MKVYDKNGNERNLIEKNVKEVNLEVINKTVVTYSNIKMRYSLEQGFINLFGNFSCDGKTNVDGVNLFEIPTEIQSVFPNVAFHVGIGVSADWGKVLGINLSKESNIVKISQSLTNQPLQSCSINWVYYI